MLLKNILINSNKYFSVMENNIRLTDNSHLKIYQTYAELKKKLPTKLFKIKVLSSPKYSLNKKPILTKIENNKRNDKQPKNSLFKSQNKNIYLLSNKTINLKKIKNLKPTYTHEYDELIKQNLFGDKESIYEKYNTETFNNFLAGLEEPAEEMEPQPYYFHSNVVKDAQMKNNIYLPKIMDRMKYAIPRSERDKNGFILEGKAIFSNKLNKDEHKNNHDYKMKE